MHIRGFQLTDYVRANSIMESMLNDLCFHETRLALARQLKWDSELVLVAEWEEQVVGLIIGTIDKNRGYVYRVLVEEVYQRQGIGRALTESLVQLFKVRDVHSTWMTVDEHNEPITPFYKALGYTEEQFFTLTNRLSIVAN
jgi:ribosomal protein S18 acetylase RimI-like enzyme